MWAEQTAASLQARLVWRPFELHPETPAQGAPKPFPPEQWPHVRQRLIDLARVVGLPMDPPQRNVNSRLALETGELVREKAGDDAMGRFHHAASRAFFVDHADVAQMDIVQRLAQTEGVSAADVAAAWEERRYIDAIEVSMYDAYRAGVAGVPAFSLDGGAALSGMREPGELTRLLAR